jgi:Tat protein translocase TatB subunit
MPQLGPLEIMVVALVALVVFGPEKLPEIARTIGKAASELRRMASEAKNEFEAGLDPDFDDDSIEEHPDPAATEDLSAQSKPPMRTDERGG